MQKLFFVDLEMCGGDSVPAQFDLEDFCEVLQRKAPEVEIVPTEEADRMNRGAQLFSPHAFDEALGEYCRQCA